MSTTTRTIPGMFEPSIYREVVDQSMRQRTSQWDQIMASKTSDRNLERFKNIKTGIGLPGQTPELAPITNWGDPAEGQMKEYVHEKESIGIRASWEAQEDDKFDVVARGFSAVGDSVAEGIELYMAQVFNNTLASDSPATKFLGFDGLPIGHDAHPNILGTFTQDNLTTGDISLSLLQFARYSWNNMRNDDNFRDQQFARAGAYVIISSDATTEPLLDQILNPINGNQPFTADYTSHELGDTLRMWQKFVYLYLNDTDRTIILNKKTLTRQGGPFGMMRRKPSMRTYSDDAIEGDCHVASYRLTCGWPDWKGSVISGG